MGFEYTSHTWEDVKTVIHDASRFIVSSHIRPDADAVGSALAMSRVLKRLGKDVWWVMEDDPGRQFKPFYAPEEITMYDKDKADLTQRDAIVMVDAGEWKRLGWAEKIQASLPSKRICIDHHPAVNSFDGVRVVDTRASSTTVMIYRLIKFFEIDLTYDLAEPIYLGIMGDTQNFHLSNTTEEAHQIAIECLRTGVEPEKVHEPVFGTTPISRLKLISNAYQTIDVELGGKVSVMYTTHRMFEEAGADWWEDEGFSDLLRTIDGVSVGIYLREDEENKVKVSWRSKGENDISISARKFGGGGHAKASGARIKGSIEEVRQIVLDEMEQRIQAGEIT